MPVTTNLNPQFMKDQPEGLYLDLDNPSWLDTLGAQLQYSYSPIFNRIAPVLQYGRDTSKTGYYGIKDEDYNAFEDIEGFEEHSEYLVENALNSKHMYQLKNQILNSKKYRQTLADSSLFAQFTTGIFDPVNLIALPFGGPTVGIAKSALRTGSGVAAITVATEAVRAPFDPMNTAIETPMNIGVSFLAGNVIGGLTGVIPTKRAAAVKRFEEETNSFVVNMGGITLDNYKNADRSLYKSVSTEDLKKTNEADNLSIKALTDELQSIENIKNGHATEIETPESMFNKANDLKDKIAEQENIQTTKKLELAFRQIDDFNNGKKEIKIDSNWAGDAFLYNAVSVPYRRILNSKAANSVKMKMLDLASDNGLVTTLSRLGIALSPAVYAKAATRQGEMARVLFNMTDDWGANGKRGEPTTILTMNVSNAQQRFSNKLDRSIDNDDYLNTPAHKLTLEQYARQIDYHRTHGTPLNTLSEAQRKSIKSLDDFYTRWQDRLEAEGLIGNTKTLSRDLKKQQDLLKKYDDILTKELGEDFRSITVTNRQNTLDNISELETSIAASSTDTSVMKEVFSPRYWNKQSIQNNRAELKGILEEWYTKNPSIWAYNTETKKWGEIDLSTNPEAISKRADDTIKNILNENDLVDFNNSYFGSGVSKHLKHRAIDIPNKLVYKFIHNDPNKVMRAYVARTAPAYEFAVKFKGKSIDELVYEIHDDTRKAGQSVEEAQEYIKDFRHMYDRIVGTVVRNPDRMSYKIANVIRSLAQLNYLGKAAYATVSEPAKLLHDHGIKDTLKGLLTLVDSGLGNSKSKLAAREVMIAGEALDIVLQSSHMRFAEDLKANPLNNNIWDKAKDVFFIANGLAPITNALKQWDGIVRQHTLIDNSIKFTNGTATEQEIVFLARYGIDLDMAKKISKAPHEKTARGLYFANTEQWTSYKEFKHIANVEIRVMDRTTAEWPKNKKHAAAFIRRATAQRKKNGTQLEDVIFIDERVLRDKFESKAWTKPTVEGAKPLPENAFKTAEDWINFVKMYETMHVTNLKNKLESKADYENRINQLALKEINKQNKVSENTVDTFRSALNTGVLNTILMGTPADKPILVDGVAYVPMRIAREFGMPEDSIVKGYARIENGLLGLPFQFYSYSLAAVSKITGSVVQGQVKNRTAAITSAIILAYMGQSLRTNEYTWDRLSYADKFARAFDYSGVLSLYSGLYYEGLHTSLALGGPDISMGLLQPKYNVSDQGPVESVAGLAGAGPSIFWDYATNSFTLATGKEIDYAQGAFQFLDGDRGTAARQFLRAAPFAGLPVVQGFVNEFGKAIDRNVD